MKALSFLILVGFFFIQTTGLIAQDVSIGFRAGASTFKKTNTLFGDDASYMDGWDYAIPVEIKFHPIFSVQPELHIIQKGVGFEDFQEGLSREVDIKTNYLELPVLFKARLGSKKLKGYAFVGPSLGFATNRYMVEKIENQDRERTSLDFVNEGPIQDKRWEFAAQTGIGGELKAGIGSIVLDVRYIHGFSDDTSFDIEKPIGYESSTNRGCTLSIGYMIPLGK